MFHVIVKKDNLKRKKNLRKFNKVCEVFERAGLEYVVHKTDRKGLAVEITQEVTSQKGNGVIVMGGDGTLHDVLNGFVDFENNCLGIIPFGTGNDFAKAAGIPRNPKKAAALIVGGSTRPVDFIELESGLRSINAVGMGIDVDVLKRAYSGKNEKKSKYLHSLIVCLARFKSYNFTVEYNGKREKHFGLIAAVGNGIQFGGGIKLFPDADIADGKLNLVIVDYISKAATVGAFIKLMTGKIYKVKQVTAVTTEAVKFIPDEDNVTFQADGELYENVPLAIRVSDSKLNLYYKK